MSIKKIAESKPQWEFFIQICIKGCDELRKLLKMDEDGRRVAGYSHHYVRDFYIYQILDEVEKVGVSLMQYAEFLGDEASRQVDASKDRQTRNIVASTVDTQYMWLRKLTEILMEVVCFQQSNAHDYYRHYLILQELRSLETAQKHNQDFYDIKNQNIEHQITNLKKWNADLLKKLDNNKVWYVKKDKNNKPKTEFNSFRKRFNENHKLFTKSQLIDIGLSSEFYSKYCSHIHPSLSELKRVSVAEVEKNIGHLAMISRDILLVCKRLLKVRAKKGSFLAQLSRIERENKYPNELFRQMTSTKAEAGDFVLVFDHLAEVLEVIKSKTGYKSIRVLFLDRPMIQGMTIDVFPTRMVRLIQKGKALRKNVIAIIKRRDPKAKISVKKLKEASRASLLHTWNNAGLKEHYFGDKNESERKRKQAEKEMNYIRKKLKLD